MTKDKVCADVDVTKNTLDVAVSSSEGAEELVSSSVTISIDAARRCKWVPHSRFEAGPIPHLK
jgi:hypothetical protein